MLEIDRISKHFKGFDLGPVSLSIREGDHFVLLGPSGSGKSVLLELIAGFQEADSGSLKFRGKDLQFSPAHKRPFGFVFQKPALFPHLSIYDNIAYPLRLKGLPKREHKAIVNGLTEWMHLSHLTHEFPARLSGGEAQRVSLARALAMKPAILLLDEPLSGLDVQLKDELRKYLHGLTKQGMTLIHVTHDFEEAVRFADQAAVIQDGKIIQIGLPVELYNQPANTFVANLCGHKNYFKVKLSPIPDSDLFAGNAGEVIFRLYAPADASKGVVIIDEQQIILHREPQISSAQNCLKGSITGIVPLQRGVQVELQVGVPLFCHITNHSLSLLQLRVGEQIMASFKASAISFLEQ